MVCDVSFHIISLSFFVLVSKFIVFGILILYSYPMISSYFLQWLAFFVCLTQYKIIISTRELCLTFSTLIFALFFFFCATVTFIGHREGISPSWPLPSSRRPERCSARPASSWLKCARPLTSWWTWARVCPWTPWAVPWHTARRARSCTAPESCTAWTWCALWGTQGAGCASTGSRSSSPCGPCWDPRPWGSAGLLLSEGGRDRKLSFELLIDFSLSNVLFLLANILTICIDINITYIDNFIVIYKSLYYWLMYYILLLRLTCQKLIMSLSSLKLTCLYLSSPRSKGLCHQ